VTDAADPADGLPPAAQPSSDVTLDIEVFTLDGRTLQIATPGEVNKPERTVTIFHGTESGTVAF